MAKLSPFEYIKTINSKSEKIEDLDGYVPFIVNRGMSYTIDTVLFANEVNMNSHIDANLQYDFYFYGIPKKKRYGKWIKKDILSNIDIIQENYRCSITRAIEYSGLLTPEQISVLEKRVNKGGR